LRHLEQAALDDRMGVTRTSVLIVGGGGREHALAWAVKRDRGDVDVICAPGNAGTAMLGENVTLDATDAAGVAQLARERAVDLVVIGPDAAAAAGVADACASAGIAVFGPTAAAARIESSKSFAKTLMGEAGIPTARWVSGGAHELERLRGFAHDLGGRCVVKADGLALGKGVTICGSEQEADDALDDRLRRGRFGEAGSAVVIEERLPGRELSVLGLTDGERVRVLVPSRDHKRAFDDDRGPNTGGMGAIAPPADVDACRIADEAMETVLQPCVDALRTRGTPFVGCLYAGLMLTRDGIRVLEFNARFGDPEGQATLPLLDESLIDLLQACARSALQPGVARSRQAVAVAVVAAAKGYPGTARPGDVIAGLDALDDDVLCFHAGTTHDGEGRIRTSGGRVLSIVGLGSDADAARASAYTNLERVKFDGMWFRRDIGAPAEVAV
ncbi:MAG TPA: phosphoribosylamine--glycine ligase, partial [Candidatus Dormibacteraeota bacterium]|nr:phosphoribosylamine--glycine ligase [Candidatus Dormibacteraeota bacterium]